VVNRPSIPEIITVNSETLQTQIRDLLPSQNGFGSELQASNVITPIIDLTSAAEGTGLPSYLQTALAFGSQTAFSNRNDTTTLANSPGFYQITFAATNDSAASATDKLLFKINDGVADKTVWEFPQFGGSGNHPVAVSGQITVWLRAGDSLISESTSTTVTIGGSVRQVATSDGTLVNPSGYPL